VAVLLKNITRTWHQFRDLMQAIFSILKGLIYEKFEIITEIIPEYNGYLIKKNCQKLCNNIITN
jgi:hypothetical protein